MSGAHMFVTLFCCVFTRALFWRHSVFSSRLQDRTSLHPTKVDSGRPETWRNPLGVLKEPGEEKNTQKLKRRNEELVGWKHIQNLSLSIYMAQIVFVFAVFSCVLDRLYRFLAHFGLGGTTYTYICIVYKTICAYTLCSRNHGSKLSSTKRIPEEVRIYLNFIRSKK